MVSEELVEALCKRARAAANNAYAPYSRFQVGAAVLSDGGKIRPGCNVENVSFGATVCAERIAIGSAVVAGDNEIVAIVPYAISGSEAIRAEQVVPCGICLQWLNELAPRAEILRCRDGRRFVVTDLMREPFGSAVD